MRVSNRLVLQALLVALSLPLTLGLAAGGGVRADDWVEFHNGRILRVQAAVLDGTTLHLDLGGGGTLSVPLERVARLETVVEEQSEVEPPSEPAAEAGSSDEDPRWRRMAGEYADLIEKTAKKHNLDPMLLASVAHAESRFNPLAISHANARGMLQLIPATAERFGVKDVFDPEQNVNGGARYLRWLLDRYEGDTALALAAYNAGEGAVDRYDGVPPYRETINYVSGILDNLLAEDLPTH